MMKNKDEIALHDYFDNLLTPGERADFEKVLVEYIDLAIDLRKLNTLHRILRNLPFAFKPNELVLKNITKNILEAEDFYIPSDSERSEIPKKSNKEEEIKTEDLHEKNSFENITSESPIQDSFVEESFIEEKVIEEPQIFKEEKIEEPERKERKKEKPEKRRSSKKKSITRKSSGLSGKAKYRIKQLVYGAIFVIFIGAAFSSYYLYLKLDSTYPWRLNLIEVSSQTNTKILPNFIGDDETLITYKGNFIRITIANKGFLELKDECEIESIVGTQSLNAILLQKGNIKFSPQNDNELFHLIYKDITIASNNSEFELKASNNKSAVLTVHSNFVEIELGDMLFKIPYNHTLKILDENHISVPLITNSSKNLVRLINQFDIQKSDKTISSILKFSKRENAFTLLSMLHKVTPRNKELIIDKLQKFFPLPDRVTKVDILLLDDEALNTWWQEIYDTM